MGRLVIPTKFNKTGTRVLRTPLEDKWVCAPANRKYRESCKAIRDKYDRNRDKPFKVYIVKISEVIASYLGSESASYEDRYRIIKFLAEGGLTRSTSRPEIADIPGISIMVQEAWQKYMEEWSKLWDEREKGFEEARYKHGVERRALWREITDHIHYQYHPEDDKRIKFEKGKGKRSNILKEKSGQLKKTNLQELQDMARRSKEDTEVNDKG